MKECVCDWPDYVEKDGFIQCTSCLLTITCHLCNEKPSTQTHLYFCVCDTPACSNEAIAINTLNMHM